MARIIASHQLMPALAIRMPAVYVFCMRVQALIQMTGIAHADGEAVVGTNQFWFIAVGLQRCYIELQLLIAVVSEGLGQVLAVLHSDDEAGPVFNRCHETVLLGVMEPSLLTKVYLSAAKPQTLPLICH